MRSWFDQMAGGTRGELLALLRRSKLGINDLATTLGISDNAVRMHIAALQRDGMVEVAGVDRTTGGKPAQIYRITTAAEELFPKAYAQVLSELIRLLEEEQGREGAERLLRQVGIRAGSAYRATEASGEERVQKAAAVLRELGGDVEVEPLPAGWLIRGYGCPLAAVAAENGEICALAEALVAEITGLPVRECCQHGDRPRCAFEVSAGPSSSGTDSPELSAGNRKSGKAHLGRRNPHSLP